MRLIRELRYTVMFLMMNSAMFCVAQVPHRYPRWWWWGILVGAVNGVLSGVLVDSIRKSVKIEQVVDKLDGR
jgi:ABC-type uncharacterized transport system permease subunit